MACFARMKASKINFFNKRPGLVWWNCLEKSQESANMETLKILMTTPSHITFSGIKTFGRSYDTDSESETEESSMDR